MYIFNSHAYLNPLLHWYSMCEASLFQVAQSNVSAPTSTRAHPQPHLLLFYSPLHSLQHRRVHKMLGEKKSVNKSPCCKRTHQFWLHLEEAGCINIPRRSRSAHWTLKSTAEELRASDTPPDKDSTVRLPLLLEFSHSAIQKERKNTHTKWRSCEGFIRQRLNYA